ncbi:2',3'-cyclic-nucleotide 3'-phosphodiesterase [Lenzites betulinus]|nr:2',3'-cyclic-nucleotide 3'-phosphodiesterase [Lenzites betulinus]
MGISLWLVPRPSQAAQIALTMRIHPPARPCSPASFPSFHPHVTLASASGADAPTALRAAIPAAQRAVPVRFASLEVGPRYFMSVYVAVHSAEGSPLEELRARLRKVLGEDAIPPVPHLSLYYIDDADAGQRERTAETLRSELRVLESGPREGGDRGVRLMCMDEEAEVEDGQERVVDILDGFDGEEIWVVRCEGPVRGWEVLEKIALTA